jgi:hypothetical protein
MLAVAVAGLSGCGGGGGGGQKGSAKVASIFKSGNFAGTVDAPTRGTSTACTIQFSNSAGVASFVAGTPGTTSFLTYSADIQNLDFEPSSDSGLTGSVSFDMVNFTAGAPYQGTLHYAGTYTWNGVTGNNPVLGANGALTGTDIHGGAVNIPFGINYQPLLNKIDLAGTYAGTINVGTDLPWTGTFTKVDDLHLAANVPYGPNGALGTISFTGQNARASFAGSFDGAQVGFAGMTGLWYVETHDNGATLIGAYVVVDSNGVAQLAGMINATKTGGTTGGTGAKLKTGYFDGGLTVGTFQRTLKLDIKNSTSTSGHNGAMIIVTNSAAENIGGRIDTVVGSGSDVTVTVKDITNTYSQVVIHGALNSAGDQFTSATFTGTLLTGGTQTGTIDQLFKVSDTTTVNMTGSWSGEVVGQSHTPQEFSGTFAQTGDELTITSNTTIGGLTVPPIHGYVAGNSFAGHVSQTLTSPIAGTFVADFDGDVDSTKSHFDGTFAYTATAGTSTITDSGTFVASKG